MDNLVTHSFLPRELLGRLSSISEASLDGQVVPMAMPKGKWVLLDHVGIAPEIRRIVVVLHEINLAICEDVSVVESTINMITRHCTDRDHQVVNDHACLCAQRRLLLSLLACHFFSTGMKRAPRCLEGDLFVVSDQTWVARIYRSRSPHMDAHP